MKILSILLIALAILSCLNITSACSVSTDKSNYNVGEMVTFYYSTNADCNAKLTVVMPDGQANVILNRPISAGQHQMSGQAWAPCGARTLIFEVSCDNNAGGDEPLQYSISGDSGSCRAEWTFNVVGCEPVQTCNQESCQSKSGFVGQQYIRNGWVYQVYRNYNCISGNCQYTEVEKQIYQVQTCDPQVCQSQSGFVGQPYSQNGEMYQDYREYSCVDGSCQYTQTPRKVPCTGLISINVVDYQTGESISGVSISIQGEKVSTSGTTGYNGIYSAEGICPNTAVMINCNAQGYLSNSESITTDSNGNADVSITLRKEIKCSIDGEVYNEDTREPISGASLLICQGESCWSPSPSDSEGYFNTHEGCYFSKDIEVTCIAEGYETATHNATTDDQGNANIILHLKPKERCSGVISGSVYDAKTGSPTPAAAFLICQNGKCWSPPASDDNGHFGTDAESCPSTSTGITCSVEGYEAATQTVTTDDNGNANLRFDLKPENKCLGSISGSVYDSQTGSPVPGASLLICQNDKCWSIPESNDNGFFSANAECCPSTSTEITCSADNYETATQTITTDVEGNAQVKFDLEPEPPKCSGVIEGHVYAIGTNEPIPGANILICQNDSCWPLSPSDNMGYYNSGEQSCPSVSAEITCSADGYKSSIETLTTDSNGHGSADFYLEPEISLEAKVSTDKKEYSIGEEITISYETNIEDAGKMITILPEGEDTSGSVWTSEENDFSNELTGTRKLTMDKPGTYKVMFKAWTDKQTREDECEFSVAEKDMVTRVWTDKAKYKLGEEITFHYETNLEGVAKRLTVVSKEDPSIVLKEFGENTFSEEMNGTRTVTTDKPGIYKVNFEAWTGKQSKNAECEIAVIEKDLALKVWTDKTEYKADEEIAIHYETGVEDAGRRITVTEQGTQTSPISRAFEENTFANETGGERTLTLNKSAAYEVRLEAWTGRESKEARCKFTVVDKDLELKVWTDKTEYKSGEEVTIYYETGVENAGRRITVIEQGTQTPLFSKTFGENTFSKETSGARNLTADKPGIYEVKLEAWTSRERRDISCKFAVLEKDLALKIWTNKTSYNAGEEITIYYETGVESAGRRIAVNSNGDQIPVVNKVFGENTFKMEKIGSIKIVLDQPGPYEIKLEAWTASDKKEAQCEITICGGTVSVRALNLLTGMPVEGATITVCAGGNCSRPVATDSSGQYNLTGLCSSTDYELTCSADGYQTYKGSNRTDEQGDSSQEILLVPVCNGAISGKVLNSITKKPVQGAHIYICINDKCSDSLATDSQGKYNEKGCPSINFGLTCSADGYKTYNNTSKTDDKGNSYQDILLEPDCSGIISGIVTDSLSKEPVQGAAITLCIDEKCSDPVTTDSSGQYSKNSCCPSISYDINCSAPGYKTYKGSVLTGDKGNSVRDVQLERELSVKVWTDKAEYKLGEEITLNYEISIPNAARRITVTEEGAQTSPTVKTFGENTFSNEASGIQKFTLNKFGAYEVKLKGWTSKDHKEATCKFKVLEDLPPKIVSLEPNKQAPQESGMQIVWSAKAEDPDGDSIYYRFDLRRAGGQYQAIRDWSEDNTWSWVTSSNDGGINSIRVSIKDGKHGEIDDSKEASFEIKAKENEKPEIIMFFPNLTQPQKAGAAVTFNVITSDYDLDPLKLKFWIKGPSTGNIWTSVTDWIEGPAIPLYVQKWTWRTSTKDDGTNEISVWVRDGKHAGTDGFDASYNLTYEIIAGNMPPNILLVSTTLSSPTSLALIKLSKGVTIVAKALDPERSLVQYRFELKEPGGDYKVLSDWDVVPIAGWLPDKAGDYQIKVRATDGKAEAERIIDYSITDSIPAVVLGLSPSMQAQAGTEVKCTAVTTELEGSPIQYKFWLNGPSTGNQWVAKTDWISEAPAGGVFFTQHIWSWIPDVKDIGNNQIRVWVRDGNHAGPEGYDASDVASIGVIKGEEKQAPEGERLELTSLWPMQSSPQDIQKSPQIMWMTSISNPDKDKLEFQFEEGKKGSDFKVVREFSSMPFFTWIPKEAGNYEIRATIRNTKGQTDSKIEDYTITDSNPQGLSLIVKNAGGHKMPPSGGNLKVDVVEAEPKQKSNLNAILGLGPTPGDQNNKQTKFEQKYDSGQDEVSIDLKDISYDSMDVSVYQTPIYSGGASGVTEYWGNATINRLDSSEKAIFIRSMPWIENIGSDDIITIKNDGDKNKVIRFEVQYSSDKTAIRHDEENLALIVVPAKGSSTVNLPLSDNLLKTKGLKIGDILYLKVLAYIEYDPALMLKGETEALVDQWDWMPNQQIICSHHDEFFALAEAAKDRSKINIDVANKIREAANKNEISQNWEDFDETMRYNVNEFIKNEEMDKKDAEITLMKSSISDFDKYVTEQTKSWKESGLMKLLASGRIWKGGQWCDDSDSSVADWFEILANEQKVEADKWLNLDAASAKKQLEGELSSINKIEKNLDYLLKLENYEENEETKKIREICESNRKLINDILSKYWSKD